jgi:hypothetical protein
MPPARVAPPARAPYLLVKHAAAKDYPGACGQSQRGVSPGWFRAIFHPPEIGPCAQKRLLERSGILTGGLIKVMVDAFLTARFRYSLEICFALFLALGAQSIAKADPTKPILISEPTSTRAIALEAEAFTPQPFSPTASSFFYDSDKRTRIMLFIGNLVLQPGDDLSVVTAGAEDAAHRHYELSVEDVRVVPGQDWMSQIILRLNENMGDVGDVLVGVSYRGSASNRVRVAIGHVGGGPPDDTGATPTPAPPYIISGRLTSGTSGISGVSVALSGPQTGTVITDDTGAYSFTVSSVGDYTLTPSKSFYSFTPSSKSFKDLSGNRTADFDAAPVTFNISGQLRDEENYPLGGAIITLTGSQQATATTDANGGYAFANLMGGGNYTVAANARFFNLNPQKLTFNFLSANQTANFTGTLRHYTVSGLVTDENKNPLSVGIIVALYRSDGFVSDSRRVDAGGHYSFADIEASYNYEVVPFDAATHTFTAQYIQELGADQTLNFSGTRRHYTINGVISDRSRQGVGNVSVTLSGPFDRSATTDASGNYSFSNLPAGNYYSLNVAKTDYIFDPPVRSYELLKDEKTDFTAIRTYRIGGRVTDGGGNGLIGMTMSLTGAETSKTITGSDGSYSFTVTTVGNYLLTPSKEQSFYTFAPSGKSFTGLSDHQTANFTGTLSPATNPSYVLEFDGSRMTVDYGSFWPANVSLGHFFWEFWAMPGENTYARYLLSDGYGGAHALLFGFHYSTEPGRYILFGDIFDGTNTTYFLSDDGPVPGEWGHYAVGWDGKNIITYYDGVPIGKQPFAGPRISPDGSWGAGMPLVGGSDHQNLIGRIAQVRAYEENNPHEGSPESSFAPQTLFSAEGQLMGYYFRPSQTVADISPGYKGLAHPGVLRGFDIGYIIPCPDCPTPRFVLDPTAPDFSNPANPGQINVPVSSPPATPDSALIFDSFSRNNSTYILSGKGGLGTTEGGSLGPQIWQSNVGSTGLQPFGILSGRAVVLANDTALAWVSTGSSTGNLDIRVDRKQGLYGNGVNTGLCFRVVDKNSFFFAYTSDEAQDSSKPKELSIGYYQSGVRTNLVSGIAISQANWKTLRVVTTQSGSIKVYANSELIYSTTSPVFASAEGAGLYNNGPGLGLTNRWDNFTVLNVP